MGIMSVQPLEMSPYGNCVNLSTSDFGEQQFDFADIVTYRYIKVVCTSPSGLADNLCAALAEVYLYGYNVVDE